MPKGTTTEERATATLIPAVSFDDIDDVESSFNDWRDKVSQSEEPGQVRAFELQLDERGNVSTTKMQVRLGSWPIDSYNFDELCQMLTGEFMDANVNKMPVRLIGTRQGERGFVFNKIVMLKRGHKNQNGEAKETTATLMKAINENNERMLSQFRSMLPQKPETDSMDEIRKMLALSQMLNAPMVDMMKTLLPALVGRPVATASDPFAGLSGVIDLAGKIADLKGGGGGENESDNDWVNILRGVAPIAKSAFEALPHILKPAAPAAQPQLMIPTPTHPLHAQPNTGSQPSNAGTTPSAGPRPVTDIPSGDAQMFAQLKPQIDALVQMAKDNADAVGAANLLFEQVMLELPDEIYSRVADLIAGENFVKNATVFNPAVGQYLPWFATFQAQIVKRIEQEDQEAGQTPTAVAPQPGVQ